MTAIRLIEDIPGEGLVRGDVIDVDAFSAASLIDRGKAEEFTEEEAAAVTELETVRYGGQDVRTIDDITDPEVARNRRVMTATVVADADAGPVYQAADDAPAEEGDAAVVVDADTGETVSVPAEDGSSTLPTPEPAPPADGAKATTAKRSSKAATTEAPDAQSAGGDADGGSA